MIEKTIIVILLSKDSNFLTLAHLADMRPDTKMTLKNTCLR
jgi:hypothetical protein